MKIGVVAFFVGSAESFCFGGRWSNWSNCEIEEGKQCGTGARIRKRQCGFGADDAQESETCEKVRLRRSPFLIKFRGCINGANGAVAAPKAIVRKTFAFESAAPTAASK